jgi:hypothetical protein
MAVEVFKTNVEELYHANMLIAEIHKRFPGYKANFDLDDCDKILRVKASSEIIPPVPIILLLKLYGFHAEVLPDEHHSTDRMKSLAVVKH